jgi:Zn-dependent peptidase ImmA (M78 family)
VDEREGLIDAFAAELLLPSSVLQSASTGGRPREELVRIAGRYRVSWSVVIGAAERADLFSADQLASLRAQTPVRGDFLAVLGEEPKQDLEIGDTGPAWRRAVLAAWERSLITSARTIELLGEALTEEDLPPRAPTPDAL